jgi:prepilin-type processing-associated H-X9-DG protein
MSSNGYFRYPIYYHNYHFWVHTKRFDTPLTDHTSPLQIMPSKAGMLCENEPDYYSLDGGNQKTATPQRMAWRHGGKAGSLEGVMNMAFFDGHVLGIIGSYSDNTNLNGTWGHTY